MPFDSVRAELHFLAQQRFLDQRLGASEFRIGSAHFRDKRGHEAVHQRVLRAQQVRMAHGTTHDAAQDIATTFVGRQHAIGKKEAGRTQVIRDHAVAGLVIALGPDRGSGFPRRRSAP